jgi:hypothetical protein
VQEYFAKLKQITQAKGMMHFADANVLVVFACSDSACCITKKNNVLWWSTKWLPNE